MSKSNCRESVVDSGVRWEVVVATVDATDSRREVEDVGRSSRRVDDVTEVDIIITCTN